MSLPLNVHFIYRIWWTHWHKTWFHRTKPLDVKHKYAVNIVTDWAVFNQECVSSLLMTNIKKKEERTSDEILIPLSTLFVFFLLSYYEVSSMQKHLRSKIISRAKSSKASEWVTLKPKGFPLKLSTLLWMGFVDFTKANHKTDDHRNVFGPYLLL